MVGRKKNKSEPVSALQRGEGDQSGLNGAAMRLTERLLEYGFDGTSEIHLPVQVPGLRAARFESAQEVAEQALRDNGGDVEKAVRAVISDHRKLAAGAGFLTGLGGFVTLPVALPANVLGFYLLATRMTAAIAHLRGYDINQPELRSAVLLTLVGSDAGDVLRKAGVVSTGRLASLTAQRLPPPVLMVVNKAIGFRLVSQVGKKALTRLGKGIPVAGGVIGAGMDTYILQRIAGGARREFPARGARPGGSGA